MPENKVQTRSVSGELRYYERVDQAMIFARANEGVWKISFNTENGERIRLVRTPEGWTYEDIHENRHV